MIYENTDKPETNQLIDISRTDIGGEFVTLAEAKIQCRITFTDDDVEVTKFITIARKHIENWCNISIVYQRIVLIADFFVSWELPYPPVIGLESVENAVALTGSAPTTWQTSEINWGIIGNKFDPIGRYRYRITYTAGNYCPADLKQAILEQIAFLYEHRGEGGTSGISKEAMILAEPFKRLTWI